MLAALVGAVAGWLVVTTANLFNLTPPLVPWLTPIALGLAAVLIGVLARTTRESIQGKPIRGKSVQGRMRPMNPQRAVTLLALAKASALAGALVAGGYLVFGLLFVGRLEAELPRARATHSGVAMLAGIALMITGLILERACEVPADEDDDRDQAR